MASALFGLRIAFDEAVAERAECIFGRPGHTLDFEIHHTPPEISCEPWDFCGASLRRLRSGDRRRARRDVRCARPLCCLTPASELSAHGARDQKAGDSTQSALRKRAEAAEKRKLIAPLKRPVARLEASNVFLLGWRVRNIRK